MGRLDSGISEKYLRWKQDGTEPHSKQVIIATIMGTIRVRSGTRLKKPTFFAAWLLEPDAETVSKKGP